MLGRRSFFPLILLPVLPVLVAAATYQRDDAPYIGPTIPTADRSAGNRVFLDHADKLIKHPADTFMILTGDVVFTKGPMIMRCDSAHYYQETESMEAFDNVSMEQGDTLFVYADRLTYDGVKELATLFADPGKEVEMINRDVHLFTDVFYYDLSVELGYYETGGRLVDPSNTLTSLKGEYLPSTKDANFYDDVHLNSRNTTDTLDIYTDSLYYNTDTHIALLRSPSRIVNDRGVIYTRLGVYDTDSNRTTLYDRSLIIVNGGRTVTADTIHYDRSAAFANAWGDVVLTDSAHNATVAGDYGFYNEATDSTFITGHALLTHFSDPDTLFLHGRYIETGRLLDSVAVAADTLRGIEAHTRVDTTHFAVVYPRVRFYRADMQGLCDSMRFTQRDTMLRMFINPVVWSEDQQIFGNIIELHLNDSTIERAKLPDRGFAAKHIEGEHYDQLSGKEMEAFFVGGELRRLDINGNVEIIMYPEESDSTINKMVSAESSFLQAYFKGRATESIKMWPETTGTATPLFMARSNQYYLKLFKWYGTMRPIDKNDIFIVPPDMETMMIESERSLPPQKPVPRAETMILTPPYET